MRFNELMRLDRDVAKKAADMLKKKGLGFTYEESQIKKYGVENGKRAEYLVDRLSKLPIRERNKLISEWRKKKIITPKVLRQMRQLQRTGEIKKRKPRIKTPSFAPAP